MMILPLICILAAGNNNVTNFFKSMYRVRKDRKEALISQRMYSLGVLRASTSYYN